MIFVGNAGDAKNDMSYMQLLSAKPHYQTEDGRIRLTSHPLTKAISGGEFTEFDPDLKNAV